MKYLSSIDMCAPEELESELRHFFSRLHSLKQELMREARSVHLNRIQRNRCRQNLLDLERIEKDFYGITQRDDIPHVYRKLQRYVKLDEDRLMDTFGHETVHRCSMFIAL